MKGLKEHWGELDISLNKDLNNIKKNYENGLFYVALYNKEVIATGAAIPLTNFEYQICRMSVSKEFRRQGIASKILDIIIEKLKDMSIRKVVLETTTVWTEVISFYRKYGFKVTKVSEDTFFELKLT